MTRITSSSHEYQRTFIILSGSVLRRMKNVPDM